MQTKERTAGYRSVCPACAKWIERGEPMAIHEQLSVWVHGACNKKTMAEGVVARYNALKVLTSAQLRGVAMALDIKVTRDSRYLDNSEVLAVTANSMTNDTKFEAAMAMQTGKKSEAPAQQSPVDLEDLMARLEGKIIETAEKAGREAGAKVSVVEHVVKVGDAKPVKLDGKVHRQFDELLKAVAAGCNVWMCGPAGSGKTIAAGQVAKALNLCFYFNGAIDTEYKLSGFVDAQGRIVSTAFRKAFMEGGVYLFDEVDASLPGALLAFNAALANDYCDFPGEEKPVKKHKDFRCIAAANTWGFGATIEYVGRNKLDAAFLDRFVFVKWEYDEALEASLCPNTKWVETVQRLRRNGAARGLKVVISPRATIFGAKLLAAGMTEEQVLERTIMAKLSQQDRENLRR